MADNTTVHDWVNHLRRQERAGGRMALAVALDVLDEALASDLAHRRAGRCERCRSDGARVVEALELVRLLRLGGPDASPDQLYPARTLVTGIR